MILLLSLTVSLYIQCKFHLISFRMRWFSILNFLKKHLTHSLSLDKLITTAELFCLFTCSWPSCQVSCHETGTRVTTRGNWLVRNGQVVLEVDYNYWHVEVNALIAAGLKNKCCPIVPDKVDLLSFKWYFILTFPMGKRLASSLFTN